MKNILLLSAILLLSGCAATFDKRVTNTQNEIDSAIQALGYTKSDIISSRFEETTKTRDDVTYTWQKKHLRLRDNYKYDWAALHKYFKTEVDYSEKDSLDLRIGEAEADKQKVRSFEYVLDKWCEVYYVEFVRDIVRIPKELK
ncbi:hypothetical protein J6U76_00060 [bacterium]|nr:hypothetical protein [bacterium]